MSPTSFFSISTCRLDGEQVLEELRAEPRTAGIPVVILSADAAPRVIRRLMASGVRAYLTKPIVLAELGDLLDPSLAAPAHDHEARGQPHEPHCAVHRGRRGQHPPGGTAAQTASPHRASRGHGLLAAASRPLSTGKSALILLDNRLPDATGGDVLRQLASSVAAAGIPVIVISGDSDDIIDELLANGAAESVAKPFDIHQFMAIIDRYLP